MVNKMDSVYKMISRGPGLREATNHQWLKCREDGRSDDGDDSVSVLYCFFSLLSTPFPLSPP